MKSEKFAKAPTDIEYRVSANEMTLRIKDMSVFLDVGLELAFRMSF